MSNSIEDLILNGLMHDETFCRKALPHLKTTYFDGPYRDAFELIVDFITDYNKLPSAKVLGIELGNSRFASNQNVNDIFHLINENEEAAKYEDEWILENTETWCKDRAVHLAVMESITIIDGSNTDKAPGMIPEILSDALSITFDTNVGHDYIENAQERYDFYQRDEEKIPFDLEMLNKITGGGVPRKTLNVIMAGCMRPDTLVHARYRNTPNEPWGENFAMHLGKLEKFLDNEYEVEVTSPDGWVKVDHFINKGFFPEYELKIPTLNRKLYSNGAHLYQTTQGWVKASDIAEKKGPFFILCEDGDYHLGSVILTGATVPIVDIHILHDNHRYYTNGVSSHNTGAGKSLAMCHLASAALADQKNVLYITMEMSEEKIAERIDANLLNTHIGALKDLSESEFHSRVNNVKSKTQGKLVVKEYPTASAHAGHFRALLTELKLKKDFHPDMIFIDYLNICTSSRMKGIGGSVNSYTLVKSIAEELRGLAVEFNVPIWSATQTNRDGLGSSDVDLSNTSESMGLAHTCDLFFALVATDEMKQNNQLMIKQLKNRYNALNPEKFFLGIDRGKMRLYDIQDPTAGVDSAHVPDEVAQSAFSANRPKRNADFSSSGFKV